MTAPTPPHASEDGELVYGKVFASYVQSVSDRDGDPDPYPDITLLNGTAKFEAVFDGVSARGALTLPALPRAKGIVVSGDTYEIKNSNLLDKEGREGVWLVASVNEVPITWRITVTLVNDRNQTVLNSPYIVTQDLWEVAADGAFTINLPDLIPNPSALTPVEGSALRAAQKTLDEIRVLKGLIDATKINTDTSAASALTYRNEAEGFKTAAETARTAAQTARAGAETARASAEEDATATAAAEARVGIEHEHVHQDAQHIDQVAAQVAAALDQANVFSQDQVPPYLQQAELDAAYVPLPIEPGSAGQVLITDPLAENGLSWSSTNGAIRYQHPRGAAEEAGNNVYGHTTFYGYGMQVQVGNEPVTFNQVRVGLASKVAGEDVHVRVYEATLPTSLSGLPLEGNSTTAILKVDTVLDSALIPPRPSPTTVGYLNIDLGKDVAVGAGKHVVVMVTSATQGALAFPAWFLAASEAGDRLPYYIATSPTALTASGGGYYTTPPRLLYASPEFAALNEQTRLAVAAAQAAQQAAEDATGDPAELPAPRVLLPPAIHAVVGDKLQVFNRSVLESPDPYSVPFGYYSTKGASFPRYFEYTPQPADAGGSPTLEAFVRGLDGEKVVTDTATIKVKAPASPASLKRVMLIGDSTMVPQRVAEARRRLVGSGGTPAGAGLSNVKFQGNQPIDGATGEGYFGYGGWTIGTWLGSSPRASFWLETGEHGKTVADQKALYKDTDGATWFIETIEPTRLKVVIYSGGTAIPAGPSTLTWSSGGTNTAPINYTSATAAASTPFWNPDGAGSFSIKYWCDTYDAGNYPDLIELVLGLNEIGAGVSSPGHFTTIASRHREFLTTARAEFPSVKAHLYGLCPPSMTGGLGTNYGAAGGYSELYPVRRAVNAYNLMLQEVASESAFSPWVTYIDQGVQFDSEHSYPASAVAVNSRSAITEQRGTNGVHPNTEGYNQLADVHYRAIVHAL